MKKFITILALLVAGVSFSQSVNDYKYVILPVKFDFLKKENQYDLNILTKMMLQKYGFTVLYNNEQKPDELALNNCRALYADVRKQPGFLSTNLIISLKDCKGTVLFATEEGKSKEKDFKKAYHAALREASRSFDVLNYQYSGVVDAGTLKPLVVKEPSTAAGQTSSSASVPISIADMPLFAQPIPNGYQLVDSTPKVVLRIYKTSQPESFTAISNTNNGVVFKKGDEWYFEYYQNDKLVSERLNIKF